ncbi:MAG TPA: DUF2007 domain-containing protein [Actinomycetota bacterium]|nr:DUF2007 domain-containing protein [Actinomycetota bacterium]
MDGVNERVRMTRLTSVGGSFAARVLQARLEDEGLTVALRGAIDSPYAFTVGAMSHVDIYVAEADLEDAKLVMLITEVDSVLDLPPQRDRPSDPWGDRAFWVLLVAIVLLGIFPIVRMATGG